MRINKYIASSGVCSRRKADALIAERNVKINGCVLTAPGYDVKEGDVVEVNGKIITPSEKKVYYLLNKPVGYVTTADDQFGRPQVTDLMTDVEERVFPVGRLDYNTSGMIIMTNDGDFAYKVSHPKHELGKTYRAVVRGFLGTKACDKMRNGVDIGGFVTSPAKVDIVKTAEKYTVVHITIHEGKYHQVRKMLSSVGCEVEALTRIAIGSVRLGRLHEGAYRKLTKQEIEILSGKAKKPGRPGEGR